MSVATINEAHGLLRHLVEREPRAPLKTVLPSLARRLKITPRRVRAIWNGEARSIDASEMDALRAAARAKQQREAADEFAELTRRIARLEALLERAHLDRAPDHEVGERSRVLDRAVGGRAEI